MDKTRQHFFRRDFVSLWNSPADFPLPLWCDMAGASRSTGQLHDPHPVSTLEFMLEGSAGLEYRGHLYNLKSGDIFFLNVGEHHRLFPKEGRSYRKLFLTVTGTAAVSVCNALFGAGHIFHPGKEAEKRICGLIEQLVNGMNTRESVSCAAALIYRILLEVSSCCPKPFPSELGEILRYLDEHIADPLTLPEMVKALHISSSHFRSLFKAYFQLTPAQYFRQLKMKKAADLLHNTDLSIKEIGTMTGYNSGLTFAREFRKNYGMRPKEFRRH
jgi:AraC-like DNA-binding protein